MRRNVSMTAILLVVLLLVIPTHAMHLRAHLQATLFVDNLEQSNLNYYFGGLAQTDYFAAQSQFRSAHPESLSCMPSFPYANYSNGNATCFACDPLSNLAALNTTKVLFNVKTRACELCAANTTTICSQILNGTYVPPAPPAIPETPAATTSSTANTTATTINTVTAPSGPAPAANQSSTSTAANTTTTTTTTTTTATTASTSTSANTTNPSTGSNTTATSSTNTIANASTPVNATATNTTTVITTASSTNVTKTNTTSNATTTNTTANTTATNATASNTTTTAKTSTSTTTANQCASDRPFFNTSTGLCDACVSGTQFVSSQQKCLPFIFATRPSAPRLMLSNQSQLIDQNAALQKQNPEQLIKYCPESTPYARNKVCIGCSDNQYFYVASGSCVKGCPDGTFFDKNSMTCGPAEYYSNVDAYWLVSQLGSYESWKAQVQFKAASSPRMVVCPDIKPYEANGVCTSCAVGLFFDIDKSKCVPCSKGREYNPALKKCVGIVNQDHSLKTYVTAVG